MRVDLQVHTTAGSPDSRISPAELATAALASGLDAVGVTEHFACDYSEIVSQVPARLTVVPGREVSCGGIHLLVFCDDTGMLRALPRLVAPNDPRLARDDVACIWAHPAVPAGSSAYSPAIFHDDRIQTLHGLELLNGRHLHFAEAISKAGQHADLLGLAMTGGSDAHAPIDVGRCFTEIRTEDRSVAGIITALRNKKTQPALSLRWAQLHGYHYRDDLERYLA